MDLTLLTEHIFEILLFPLLAVCTSALVVFIKVKKQELLAKTDNDLYKKYIEMLDNTITDCVIATNQTFVTALKKEGNFTKESQKAAFEQTYNAVLDILTDDAQDYLNLAVNDLNAYITNKIESQVVKAKQLSV